MNRVFALDLGTVAPSPIASFGDLVNIIVKNAFMLAAVLTFLLLVLGGFGVIMGAGAGDTKKLEQGQKTITGAVLGLILIVVSYWIVQILEKLTGMTLLSAPLP